MAQSGGEGGAGWTVGVEEEFLLVDPDTRCGVPLAAAVLERAGGLPAPAGDAAVHLELLASQVESATGVCTRLDELTRQLTAGRRRLAEAARAEGARLVSSGTPVLHGPVGVAPGGRFRRIADAYAGVMSDYQSCGCHVHVGVPDRDTAVAVVNHLRPWLPTLLALSVNSPYDRGRESGCASWRAVEQSRFPGGGVPPWFPSAAAYDAALDRLVECGVLMDRAMTFWLARPSSHLPTVEIRAADAAIGVPEAVLQAALSRALVRTALAELAAGREAPPPGGADGQLSAAALWAAARHGLSGPGVDPLLARQVPAPRLVERLLDLVAPELEETGDLAAARAAAARLLRVGTGAVRQCRAGGAGPAAVVDMLIEETSGS
ncbi:carboxylate-amine ligase [Peterkaempfera bronchialis]|uniref:carboxylate-amine ligase n=1 Tax=Peterkaempfera bronchialis TaxID=2126346 RepID=UPI003C2CE45B